MNQQELIKNIRRELIKNIDKKYQKTSKTFFKEKINNLGVRSPIVKKISSKYCPEFEKIVKKDKGLLTIETKNICEQLLRQEDEFKTIAFNWIFQQKDCFTENNFLIFEDWYKKYVTNWSTCDDFCTHAFGYLIYKFPELTAKTEKWTRSKNRWLRRASAVVLIYSLRRDKHLREAFKIADTLLEDSDDLVRKGYGWMLKEAANLQEEKVFKYVIKNKKKMPRTALRYAIEKMPIKLKKEAMAK